MPEEMNPTAVELDPGVVERVAALIERLAPYPTFLVFLIPFVQVVLRDNLCGVRLVVPDWRQIVFQISLALELKTLSRLMDSL